MICCNKHKSIEKSPQYFSIRRWVLSVQEDCYVLGHLCANTASTPSVKYRHFLKEKLAVYEVKESSTNYYIEMILADIPKGERN